MAPEQAAGGDVSHRTDLFSLGVITYRALTGRPAFSGDSAAVILYNVVKEMPPRPSEISGRLGDDVDLMLGIALAKDPADRFDSAAELAEALEKALRGRLPGGLRERAEAVLEKHPWG
jgi:serine/threonine-protein kinase